jgi:membrane protein YdbS with pleckstrin-like domain
MSIKKVLRILFQIPAWLLLIISFGGSIYGYYAKISGITLATPIILFVVILLYFIGRVFLKDKKQDNEPEIITGSTENLTDYTGFASVPNI